MKSWMICKMLSDREKTLDGLSRSIQRLRMIIETDMPPCLAVSELDLMESWLSKLHLPTGDCLNELTE